MWTGARLWHVVDAHVFAAMPAYSPHAPDGTTAAGHSVAGTLVGGMPNYSARVDRAREGMVRARIAQRLASEVVAPLRMVKQPRS
jgi:hypothetical protein